MIHRSTSRYETAKERARVAAELQEEARFLTETGMLGLVGPTDGGTNGNGNGAGAGAGAGAGHKHVAHNGRNGNGNGHGQLAPDPSVAERALDRLDAALTATPDSVALLLERATQLGAMGRYKAARADLERALALDPDNDAIRTALGIVLLRKGLWADAVPHLRRVAEVESWSPTAWFYLGEALNHVDDLDGALAAYGRAAELDPHHAKALYGQGVVLDRLRRPEDATRLYRRSREAAAR